jgi:hypothetical protein
VKVNRVRLLVCFLALFGAGARVHAAGVGDDYLHFGGFETGDFSGWNWADGLVTPAAAHSGNYGDQVTNGGMGYVIDMEKGATYKLVFYLRADNVTAPMSMHFDWNFPHALTVTTSIAMPWTRYEVDGLDTSIVFDPFLFPGHNCMGMSFLFNDFLNVGGGSWSIDDIQFIMTQRTFVPETLSGFWLLLPLILLVGTAARIRNLPPKRPRH